MINRIRDIRKEKGMTLADLAEACDPPTTAQTIGRLETGMRNLSTKWMDRIGKALGVSPEALVRAEESQHPQVVATDLGGGGSLMVLDIAFPHGEYRPGDQLWLRRIAPEEAPRAINRDVLVPRKGGRFAFGRLIDRKGTMVGVLPPGAGEKQQVIDAPEWLAVAEMLVRRL